MNTEYTIRQTDKIATISNSTLGYRMEQAHKLARKLRNAPKADVAIVCAAAGFEYEDCTTKREMIADLVDDLELGGIAWRNAQKRFFAQTRA